MTNNAVQICVQIWYTGRVVKRCRQYAHSRQLRGREVLEYVQENELYAVVQSDDAATIADMPQGFTAREW